MSQIHSQIAVRQNNTQDNFDKGRDFESYVTRLFNAHSFHLKKWREAKKFADTFYSMDYSNPDLELELVFTGARKYRFAVECKWRKKFKDGRIKWASDYQRRHHPSQPS